MNTETFAKMVISLAIDYLLYNINKKTFISNLKEMLSKLEKTTNV